MIDQIFSVYDEKAQAYLPPFFMHNEQLAIRTFADCINSPKHQFHHHPSDYTLFHLGEFDNDNAGLLPRSAPTSLGNGVEFISRPISTEEEYDGQVGNDPQFSEHPPGGNP